MRKATCRASSAQKAQTASFFLFPFWIRWCPPNILLTPNTSWAAIFQKECLSADATIFRAHNAWHFPRWDYAWWADIIFISPRTLSSLTIRFFLRLFIFFISYTIITYYISYFHHAASSIAPEYIFDHDLRPDIFTPPLPGRLSR